MKNEEFSCPHSSRRHSADRILVLDGGRIVESGPPEQLRVTGGWFARFARSGVGRVNEGVEKASNSGDAPNKADSPTLEFPTKTANQ